MREQYRERPINGSDQIGSLQRRNNTIIIFALITLLFLLIYEWKHTEIPTSRERYEEFLNKVESDFLIIGNALNRYRTDNEAIPIGEKGMHSLDHLWRLTTPHPYLYTISDLKDPFHEEGYWVGVFDTKIPRMIVMSTGPNQRWDGLTHMPEGYGDQILDDWITKYQYDPSNGNILWPQE